MIFPRHASFAALVFVVNFMVGTEAFFALVSKSENPQDDHTHYTMSHEALLTVVAKYLEDNPRTGSSVQPGDLVGLDPLTSSSLCTAYYGEGQVSAVPLEEAILEMIEGNLNVDYYEWEDPEPHFNAEEFAKGNRRLQDLRDVVIENLQDSEPDYTTARTQIGEYLHIVQDFYSNANWVEMSGPIAYEDLGLSGVDILPVAKNNDDTCKDCDDSIPGDCDNNLIVGVDTLTSGYRSGQGKKPKGKDGLGKCSHGGENDETRTETATGGINKESRDMQLSPHSSLHQDATTAAMNATENFFLAEGYGLRYHISDEAFLELFNLRQNSSKSLSIAMDVTGSMSDDIEAAKQECHELIDELVGTVNEPANYVLVPFSDPDYGPAYVTTDAEAFKDEIDKLVASGGGDCPELSMSGTGLAVQHSLPGSDLYVFTDASAKDLNRTENVTELAKERDVRITYLLTGDCGYARSRRSVQQKAHGQFEEDDPPTMRRHSRRKRSVDAYQAVAEETGGIVLEVTKDELDEATEIISLSFEGSEVSAVVVDLAGSVTVTFPVDNTVSQVEIAVTASDATLTKIDYALTDPNGHLRTDSTEVVNNGEELILVINATDVGEWGLTLNDDKQWHIVVNATSPVDFLYTFYTENDAGQMVPLYGSPAIDQEVSLFVSIIGQEHVSSISEFILAAQDGTELKTMSALSISEGAYIAQTTIPRADFGIQVKGLDSKSAEFQRTKSVGVKVQAVSLEMQNGVSHSLDPGGVPLQINFTVSNHGDDADNYTVTVEDELFVQYYFPDEVQMPSKLSFSGYIIAAVLDNDTESGTTSNGLLKVFSDITGTSNEIQFQLVVMDYVEYYREIDEAAPTEGAPTVSLIDDGGGVNWGAVAVIVAVSVVGLATGVIIVACAVKHSKKNKVVPL